MRWRGRRVEGPREVVALPDWRDHVDVESGRVLLDEAPPIDVSGFDVRGQGAGEEGDVDRLGEVALGYFASGHRPVPAPGGGPQLPLPSPPRRPVAVSAAPVRALQLVSEVEVEGEAEEGELGRVSLFDDDVEDDEEDDDD